MNIIYIWISWILPNDEFELILFVLSGVRGSNADDSLLLIDVFGVLGYGAIGSLFNLSFISAKVALSIFFLNNVFLQIKKLKRWIIYIYVKYLVANIYTYISVIK